MAVIGRLRAVHQASLLLAVISITLFWASVAKAGEITQTTCPVVIAKSGEYLLANDIGPCAAGVDGIDILASGVTLLLNGHTITGAGPVAGACPSDSGISVGSTGMPMVRKVAILGAGTINNFGAGVQAVNSANSSATMVTVTAPECTGLGFGFVVSAPGGGWTIYNNVVREPGISSYGIGLGVNGNTVFGNIVNDSIGVGVALVSGSVGLSASSKNAIFNNIANDNLGGVLVYPGSNNNQIYGNITNDNNSAGLCSSGTPCSGLWLMQGATGNIVTGNTSFGNIPFDMEDDNANCDSNKWEGNHFKTANESCIH